LLEPSVRFLVRRSFRFFMNRRTIVLCVSVVASVILSCRGEEPIRLPEYSVSADIIAKMVPRDQVADIARQAAQSTTFRFDEITMAKAPSSLFPRPVKCLVRDAKGKVLDDVTNERLTIPVDVTWKTGFLSSNQPAEFSRFYLLLRPKLDPAGVSIGFCEQLLDEYATFSQRRLDAANRYYSAGHALAADLVWYTVPDQIALAFRSPEACADTAHAVGVKPQGRILRLDRTTIENLLAKHGRAWTLAARRDVDCVTPWAALGPLPEIRDGAALFRVGWIEYTRDALDRGTFDLVAVAMWFPR
jgi:hypothetical protein